MNNFNKQASYNGWATGQWINFVYSNAGHDVYLYRLVNHIVKGERAWLERITGLDWNRDLWEVEPRERLLTLRNANGHILDKILETSLEDRIDIKRLNGQTHNPKVADILQHIFYHSENHRGQLASFSAKAGLTYPSTDYMSFCIMEKV